MSGLLDMVRRRARQLKDDPALRQWLMARALGRVTMPAPFSSHCPPYLTEDANGPNQTPTASFAALTTAAPTTPLDITLSGTSRQVLPSQPGALFTTPYDDTEALLAAHRFAWVPLAGAALDPAWISLLWQTWMDGFGTPDDSWAWHPYTASERLINIIDVANRDGLAASHPQTIDVLSAHGPAIYDRLEYFGDHDTSNHLANNGRGLFVLGVSLNLPYWADRGADILRHEANRIFAPSGVLREGSSHYHLLLTRNYIHCWLLAEQHGHAAAAALKEISHRALSVLPSLDFSAGLPLIGDISPDCPPEFLSGLFPGANLDQGWTGLLSPSQRTKFKSLRDGIESVSDDTLLSDGWTRLDYDSWSGLWFLSPDGWSPMPGHGHQDAGSFELHHDGEKIFVDPGRGNYGEEGDAALYRSAHVHNTILIDDAEPYPPNKPYYTESFRQRICGEPPSLSKTDTAVTLRHAGYSRFSNRGVITRQWSFSKGRLTLDDTADGRGRATITRRLHTPLAVTVTDDGVTLESSSHIYHLRTDSDVHTRPITLWSAYGVGKHGTAIDITTTTTLPYAGSMTLDVIT